MKVYKIGTQVRTKIGNFEGIITEIRIMGNNDVSYSVSYEKDGITTMYFYEFELIFGEFEKNIIGFKTKEC